MKSPLCPSFSTGSEQHGKAAVPFSGEAPRPLPRRPRCLGGVAVLQKRADFLRAAAGLRQSAPAFLLQAVQRGDDGPPRVGFTCSKKVGNAVERGRARRRLREIARLTLPQMAQPGWDYVLIGRAHATAERAFDALLSDLHLALDRVHSGKARPAPAHHATSRSSRKDRAKSNDKAPQ